MSTTLTAPRTRPRDPAAEVAPRDDGVPNGQGVTDFAALVAGCKAGQREAQRRLYEACKNRVYRVVLRMVAAQDADDVAQRVFLRLFCSLHQFAGRAQFMTWLNRIVANECFQHLRHVRRSRVGPLAMEPVDRARSHVERLEQGELLEQALARLSPDLRCVFHLREVEQLSYDDIAAALGLPSGTIASRLNRARSELARHLDQLGWHPPDRPENTWECRRASRFSRRNSPVGASK